MILILCTSRTGSSLITGIFAAHGLHYGETGYSMGYQTYEDRRLKAHLKTMGAAVRDFVPDKGGTAKLVERHGIELFKCGVEYWPAFESLSPHVVKVKRHPVSAAQSVADKRGADQAECLANVLARYQMLDRVPGVTVWSDDVIAGDYAGLRAAFESCGLEFDPDKAAQVVRPELWNY